LTALLMEVNTVWPMAAVVALAAAVALVSSCAGVPRRKGVVEARLGEKEWRSDDGKEMPFSVWKARGEERPRAVVIAVHGLSGASSDFWQLGERLAARGMVLYAYELRGQGNDPVVADRGHIQSAKVWQRDLRGFDGLIRERHPGVPVVWFGESLGSLIVLHTAVEGRRALAPDGLVLSSPAAGLRLGLPGGQRWLLDLTALLRPRKRLSLRDLAGGQDVDWQVTKDTTYGSQMAVTPHFVPAFTLRLLSEMGALMRGNAEAARKVRMPVLVLASPHDVVASPEQVEALFQELGTREKVLRWYRKSYHLLLHDVEREQVLADVEAWLEARCGGLQ